MRKLPAIPLSPGQARELVEACGGGWSGKRNRALVTILWRCGLRASEACALELGHLMEAEAEAMRVTVAKPKGWARAHSPAKPRTVGLGHTHAVDVRAWISMRGEWNSRTLFVSRTGHPLQPSYLRQLMPHLARRAGIDRRVHPHALRHTFAKELYEEGVGILGIMEALGHRNLATTYEYLRTIGATEAVDATLGRNA